MTEVGRIIDRFIFCIMLLYVSSTCHIILSPECSPSPPVMDVNPASPWHHSLSSLFSHQSELMSSLERGRPDHTNYRLLIWKCVAGFGTEFSESRSRILVPLLLRFVQLVNHRITYLHVEQNLVDQKKKTGYRFV